MFFSLAQVQLLSRLFFSWSNTWARLHRHGIFRQTSSIPEAPAGAAPSSPVRSSAGTALPDTSTCSPSADLGSPTEVCSPHAVKYLSRLRELYLQGAISCSSQYKQAFNSFKHNWNTYLIFRIMTLPLHTLSFSFLLCFTVKGGSWNHNLNMVNTADYWLHIKIKFFCMRSCALWTIKGQTILD